MKASKSRIIAGAVTMAEILVNPLSLQAQSCALCYQSAAASGTHFIQALKDGILILLLPPILISLGIALLAYRRRNMFGTDVTRNPEAPHRSELAAFLD